MIFRLDGTNADAYLAACEEEPVIGAQLRADLLVYGADSRDAGFWVQTDERGAPSSAISCIDGRVWVTGAGRSDGSELSAFLRALGGFDRLTAPGPLTASLDIPGARYSAPIMEYRGGPFHGNYGPVAGGLTLDELYDINAECFPGFAAGTRRDMWCAYTSHLLRHGHGFAAGVRDGGRLVSTAGVYATGLRYGVIACVATRKGFRGKGHAALLVRYLCDRLIGMGLTPALLCAEDGIAPYYGRMGFQHRGCWERITLGGST